jgi:putative DNA primase/helicase
MSLQSIARALGGVVNSGAICAPGPRHSKHDRSMRVFLDSQAPDGFRVKSFAGDDWRACREEVKARLGGALGTIINEPRYPAVERGRADDRAIELWSEARPVHNSPAENYLACRTLTPPAGDAVLRFHPRCPFKLEDDAIVHLPALVAIFNDILTNEPCGIHRTALKPDGSGKADLPGLGTPKKMLGRAQGAAIKLCPDADVTMGLGIAEGIESGLTAFCANWRPIWVLGSAGAISTFPVLAGVEILTIFADADPAGMKAARACQARWPDCRIVVPHVDGTDLNDLARAAC